MTGVSTVHSLSDTRPAANDSGFISSLEAGYPFPFPWLGPTFVLEPQGQIIWQEVSFRGANDGPGPVGLGTTSGATGRLGLRGKWTFVSASSVVWRSYVQANLWRDWGAEATTMFGTDPVPLSEQATQLEFAGGITAKFGPASASSSRRLSVRDRRERPQPAPTRPRHGRHRRAVRMVREAGAGEG
jgi:outer membrane autotransporter protein